MNNASFNTKVAIIGMGKIGWAIAANLVKGNHPVIIASRDLAQAEKVAGKLGPLAVAKETEAAIQEADVVIPALYFNVLKEFLSTYSKALEGKTIVDVSNPIAPDEHGGFKKIIGENESAGAIISELIPTNAKLVKAFGTLGAGTLSSEAFSAPDKKVLFYASDNTNSNPQIEALITSSGFAPLHIGGIDQAIRIEVFGDLHEFGTLGKTVTLNEAKATVHASSK